MIEIRTIKDIAKIANISKTSVYNLLKKHNIQTFKKEGITYLDEKAESLILSYYSGERQKTIDDIITNTKEDLKDNFQPEFQHSQLDEYRRFIEILENELQEKNKTIQGLINALTAEKINDAAQLMLQDIKQQTADKPTDPAPSNFFKRLFKKYKG